MVDKMTNNWEKIIQNKIKVSKSRTAKKRGWVVIRKSLLTSSINYRLELAEQAIFTKLIIMADELGAVPGLISDNNFQPIPRSHIAHLACCPLSILETTIKKCVKDGRIYENGHGIFLTNFDAYQYTEYDRQKPYRDAKRANNGKGNNDEDKYSNQKYGDVIQR